ncbi:MAG: efflux RND transporter periplasmic adaptor subunit [Bryobacteraceae bacterium]
METRDSTLIDSHPERIKVPPRARVRPLLTFFAVLGLIVIMAIVAGVLPRLRREKLLASEVKAGQALLPVVNVTAARRAPANAPLELPGDLQANVESPIFARADGFLVKRNVDIGDRVKKGQVLAELETPELDQQIQQARATISNSQSTLKELQAALGLANANLNLAQATYRRWEALEKKGIMSHQEAEEKLGMLEIRKAEVEAAGAKMVSERDLIAGNEANLRRLQQMKAYSRVTAPFDGIITARNVDIGTLINSGNGGAAKEMFRIAEIATMRIFVNVPQSYVGAIHDGERGELRVQELPGCVFQAVVSRFTHEVDTGSRSMLAILLVPNPQEVLLPGMYAQVRFSTSRANSALLIPGDALITGSKGTRVAAVDAENRVHFRDVRVGIDYGTEVEILSGLAAGDLVVMNPTDSVREDARVEVRKTRESGR